MGRLLLPGLVGTGCPTGGRLCYTPYDDHAAGMDVHNAF
jgi:hypothetical protein